MFRALAFAATLAAAAPAQAEMITTTVDGSFDDLAFAVESAIVGLGLVIDHVSHVSHVGEMLERTMTDVGGTATIFTQADIFLFCSASLSRKAMQADPANILHCPYGITVMETPDAPGKVTIGHRR